MSFGISASYLISASMMAAPASLALSKLIYPETEKSMATAANMKALQSRLVPGNLFGLGEINSSTCIFSSNQSHVQRPGRCCARCHGGCDSDWNNHCESGGIHSNRDFSECCFTLAGRFGRGRTFF